LAKETTTSSGPRFEGFPPDATRFFTGIAANNNREWFQSNKETYEQAVREPMKALVGEFEPRFGRGSISRINRDNRFFKDRPPYKTHIAAGVGDFYLSLSSNGLYIGAGLYRPTRPRSSVFAPRSMTMRQGRELETDRHRTETTRVSSRHARTAGIGAAWIREGSPARRSAADERHSRGKLIAPGSSLSSRHVLDTITRAMTDLKPFVAWIRRHTG
jgi:hypothetical protein